MHQEEKKRNVSAYKSWLGAGGGLGSSSEKSQLQKLSNIAQRLIKVGF